MYSCIVAPRQRSRHARAKKPLKSTSAQSATASCTWSRRASLQAHDAVALWALVLLTPWPWLQRNRQDALGSLPTWAQIDWCSSKERWQSCSTTFNRATLTSKLSVVPLPPFLSVALYIYIYVFLSLYTYAVELKKLVQDFGACVKTGPGYKLKIGPSFSLFSHIYIFIVFGGMFQNTNRVNLCQTSVFAKLSGCQKWGFWQENCILVFFMLLKEKHNKRTRKEKGPQTI